MSSEVQELSFQIKLCLRVKRFVVTDNCVYVSIDDKYFNTLVSISNSCRMCLRNFHLPVLQVNSYRDYKCISEVLNTVYESASILYSTN